MFRVLIFAVRDKEFRGLFTLVLLLLFSGAWFYHTVEGWGWIDALYFTVITLSTVGYGDFSPTTPLSKIFTITYIFLGLGTLSAFILLLAEKHREFQDKDKTPDTHAE
jgi:voltage-gated potassium channel Kch